jgi:thiamine biosynthesis lipoprotein
MKGRLVIGRCLVLWLAGVSLLQARPGQSLVRLERSDDVMGTTFSVVLYGDDRPSLESAAAESLAEAHRLDRLLSNYISDSEWSRVNRDAARGPVQVSAELFDLLAACLEYSRASDGAFDITVGPLMKTWGFFKGEGSLAPASAVSDAMRRVGYQHVRLDRDARTVMFDAAGVEIDPGGIGKGYAVDRMADVLRRRGITAARISGGGSSIYGLGAPPDDPRGWQTPVRDPADPQRAATEVWLKDSSLSTSGGYEKFFRANGRVYAHIMDPRTGYPAEGTAAVSVVAPRTIDSEAWAKPFFVNGLAWTTAHVPDGFRVFFCAQSEPCSWIPAPPE